MNHPNACAAFVASAATIGAQWLVQRYAHMALSDYWKMAITSGATVAVLYVGRAGVKGALGRLWNGPKTIWSGATAKTATAAK
jgi:hypothetical protein